MKPISEFAEADRCKNITISGILCYTLGYAFLFALLSYSRRVGSLVENDAFIVLLTFVGALSGRLLCSIWSQPRSVRWVASTILGGLCSFAAFHFTYLNNDLYALNFASNTPPPSVWAWVAIAFINLTHGLLIASALELAAWIFLRIRLSLQ